MTTAAFRRCFSSTATALMTDATKALADGVLQRDIRSLSKAITLVESSRPDHHQQSQLMMNYVTNAMPKERQHQSFRIGISGPPGVGKSTFIESFGCHIVKNGHKAVDPSSPKTGGSILGDKTRMLELSNLPNAYVRPSPTRGSLGGVTRTSSSAATLCVAAGHDIVIFETVGVGQSEYAVASMCDLFMLLAAPGAGDELQGIKKGIMEMADIIVVNKADQGNGLIYAQQTASQIASALRLVRSKEEVWFPKTLLCSAKEKTGIEEVWKTALEFKSSMQKNGELYERRKQQNHIQLHTLINEQLLQSFDEDEVVQRERRFYELQIDAGTITPTTAVDRLIALYFERMKNKS